VAAEMRALTTPSSPASATAVEDGEVVTEASVTQAALEASSNASSGTEGVVMVSDEDSAASPPPPSESHDVAMAPALEPA
jgi:hypothetical protein